MIAGVYVEKMLETSRHNEVLRKQRRLADTEEFTEYIRELLTRIHSKVYQMTHSPDLLQYDEQKMLRKMAHVKMSADFFQTLCDDYEFNNILTNMDIPPEDRVD